MSANEEYAAACSLFENRVRAAAPNAAIECPRGMSAKECNDIIDRVRHEQDVEACTGIRGAELFAFAKQGEPRVAGREQMQYENEVLNERQGTHGDFAVNAMVAQTIKQAMRTAPNWERLTLVQREALELLATKLGRIMAGDTRHLDHWNDIVGYVDLIRERLKTCA